jgi:hypothetical protein
MKYGKEITAKLGELLSQGMGRVDSCNLAGISYETFTVWMEKPEFSESIKKAETICKQRNIVRIQNASRQSWQAAAWWLERKYPDEFAMKTKMEHSGQIDTPIKEVDLSRLTDAQLVRLADALEKNQPKD